MSDLQSLIDDEKWNAAKWKATGFLHDPDGVKPPCMALVFENIEIGKQIFSDWLRRLGKVDEFEALRIGIVEGAIRGERPGYSVHVSSNPWHIEKRAIASGVKSGSDLAVVVGRVNRMTPEPGSPHLARFKQELARHRRYSLIPITAKVEPQFDYAIEKTEIFIRPPSKIAKDDVDAVVFPASYFEYDAAVN